MSVPVSGGVAPFSYSFQMRLIFGTCSNLSVNSYVKPKTGTNVFWNGLKLNGNTYQFNSALFICF